VHWRDALIKFLVVRAIPFFTESCEPKTSEIASLLTSGTYAQEEGLYENECREGNAECACLAYATSSATGNSVTSASN
jgi:hypothetical protein